jgi:hypothetical protein
MLKRCCINLYNFIRFCGFLHSGGFSIPWVFTSLVYYIITWYLQMINSNLEHKYPKIFNIKGNTLQHKYQFKFISLIVYKLVSTYIICLIYNFSNWEYWAVLDWVSQLISKGNVRNESLQGWPLPIWHSPLEMDDHPILSKLMNQGSLEIPHNNSSPLLNTLISTIQHMLQCLIKVIWLRLD